MIRKYLFLFISLITVFACEDPFDGKRYVDDTTSDEPMLNNGEWLTAHSDRFSLWIEILKRGDQFNAISNSNRDFTLFAPDNDAVKRFLDLKGVKSVEDLSPDYAKDVAQLHIIESVISKNVFLVGGRLNPTSTFGTYLTVSFVEDSDNATGTGIWINDAAEVIDLAEETTNGSVYTLNNVLLPVTETVYDQIALHTDYSIFKEALELTGWGERLKRNYDTITSDYGLQASIKLKFTCFVVPNDAYAREGISSVAGLAEKLNAGSGNYTDTTNALYQYVAYHIMNKTYYEASLYPFPQEATDTAALWAPEATNQMFTTNLAGGEKFINYAANSFIRITNADIEARNGLLHEVDHYMPVFTPTPLTVLWDLCDYADVESVVNARGEKNNLGNCFGVRQTEANIQLPLYSSAAITSYDFAYYNSSSRETWNVLGYYLPSAKMDSIRSSTGLYIYANGRYPYHYDLLCLNLGYMGWITMPTPTILKGKYKVNIYYLHLDAYMADFVEGGSPVTLTLDNDENLAVQASFYSKLKQDGIHSLTLFNEIEFDSTQSHELKIVLQDQRASSHKTYALLLDYIEFIPITE